jgi:hypothetical protein
MSTNGGQASEKNSRTTGKDGTSGPAGKESTRRTANSSANGGQDVKDKFRQALDRKRGNQAERDAAGDGLGGSKIQSEHAAAKTQRTFRRKSGG